MKRVKDILSRKGSTVFSIAPETKVLDGLKMMAEKNIGSLVIADADGNFLGVFSERDYSRKVALEGRSSSNTTAREIMSTNLPRVSPFDTVEYCMQLMTDNNIRYLPVFFNEQMKGIVSMSDVVKETILQQQETITHLETYIYSYR